MWKQIANPNCTRRALCSGTQIKIKQNKRDKVPVLYPRNLTIFRIQTAASQLCNLQRAAQFRPGHGVKRRPAIYMAVGQVQEHGQGETNWYISREDSESAERGRFRAVFALWKFPDYGSVITPLHRYGNDLCYACSSHLCYLWFTTGSNKQVRRRPFLRENSLFSLS